MFTRNIKPHLLRAISRSPVVLLNGARQVGKTTLALELDSEQRFNYITFDDELVFLAAQRDPVGFVKELQKPVIIDEVQRVPEIFLPIKRDVDEHKTFGRYLLTGSANPLLIPRMGDSLAGRMEVIDLMPLSQGEISGNLDLFIDRAFNQTDTPVSPKTSYTKEELYKKIVWGGYPRVQEINFEDRSAWLRSYINLLLQKDIKELAQMEKLIELPDLLRLIAARASGLLNVADLSRESKISVKTLNRYLAVLETTFIVNTQRAWSTNLSLRITKAPKVYMIDSGLLTYLLDMDLSRALTDSMAFGKVLENFVVSELKKQATWSAKSVALYHFRTASNIEVDIVLEDRSGNVVGIEVKSSERITGADFSGLSYLKEKLGPRFIRGFVLYPGTQTVPFGDRLFAAPVHMLWEKQKA